jgi:hypothetical protein
MIPIILSTACYHRVYDNVIDSALRAIKPNHEIDGIEISLLSNDECLDFEPDGNLIGYSKNNSVFIHAPIKGVIYSKNPLSGKILDKIKNVYDSLNAKNATFHLENIESVDYLANQMEGYNISIENPYIKNADKNYFESLKNYLEKYNLGLTLDLEHSRNDLIKFLNPKIKKRIFEIHYSNYNPNFNHDCYSAVFERFDKIICAIKEINRPVVIEIDLRKVSQLNDEFIDVSNYVISKEIALIKKSLISF